METLQDKVLTLRRLSRQRTPLTLPVGLESTVITACVAAFPGSTGSMSDAQGILTVRGWAVAKASFQEGPMQAGMFSIYRPHALLTAMSASSVPIRLGRVLRVADDVPSHPFVVVESWWPVVSRRSLVGK